MFGTNHYIPMYGSTQRPSKITQDIHEDMTKIPAQACRMLLNDDPNLRYGIYVGNGFWHFAPKGATVGHPGHTFCTIRVHKSDKTSLSNNRF
jgi:hypothetical protein